MSESLDEAFSNIYQSEQESNAQHEYLQKLKSQISAIENEVKETGKKCQELEEEISKKMKRLANREVMLLSLNVRQKCLQERIKELKSENKDLKKTMEELKARLKSSRETLCKQSAEFIEEHTFFNKRELSTDFLHQTPLTENYKEKTENSHSNTTSTSCDSYNINFLKEREEVNNDNESLWLFDVDFGKENNDWLTKET